MEPPDNCPKCNEKTSGVLKGYQICMNREAELGCPLDQFLQKKPFTPVFKAWNVFDQKVTRDYAIFDLDGVLCGFSALRKRLYENGCYDEVNSIGVNEPMISSMVELSQSLHLVGVSTFVCTSRDAAYSEPTIMQLNAGGVPWSGLLMRGHGDHKSSSAQLKEEMWVAIQLYHPKANCIIAVDDRADMVALYRHLGLNGVLCNEAA